MSSTIHFNLEESKILSSGNGLTLHQMTKFDRTENIVGNGENAGYQHFIFSQHVSKGPSEIEIVW